MQDPDETPAPTELTRRTLLKVTAGAAGRLFVGCRDDAPSRERAAPRMASIGPPANPMLLSSAVALATAMRTKQISATELVDAYLARIDAVNPELNAVVQLRGDAARAEARAADEALARGDALGPLHGVPMTIKDSLDTEGVISTGGTLGRARFVPTRDATVVRRLREAGAILLGKTNTPEFTLSYETDNRVYGRTNNPWDLNRTPGGSSGGAAAILAAGGAAFDIGSDYGGSIRLPASFCGIAGLKPTHGRVPRTGHLFPFGGTHDLYQQLGPLARHVEDLLPILRIIAGPDHIDPAIVPMPLGAPSAVHVSSLRIGFHTDNGISTPTDAIQAVVRSAASAMQDVGAVVANARPLGIERSFDIGNRLAGADGGAAMRRLLREAGTAKSELATDYRALDAVALDRLLADWYAVRSEMSRYWQDHDVILCPVNARVAGVHGATTNWGAIQNTEGKHFSYTMAYNVTGWPAGVVRGGTSPAGLPIGVQVVAAPGREDIVLAVLSHLEQALGGFRPPTA